MRARCIVIPLLVTLAVFSLAASANDTPVANFSAYRLSEISDMTVLLDASDTRDTDGEIVSYKWVFGDGTSGSGIEAEHTFPRVDRFNVTLLAFDDGGAWHMITKTIDLSVLPAMETGATSPQAFARETSAVAASVPIGTGIGQRAPDFALPDHRGETVNLSDFRGKLVLLEFWRTTCPACQVSVAHLDLLRRTYEQEGLVVLLVSLGESSPIVDRYLTSYAYTGFVSLIESRGFYAGTAHTFGVNGTPRLLLIDRSGVIRYNGSASGLSDELVVGWL